MPSLPFLVNCSTLFTEWPLLERPAAARDAGFDAVEFWWPFESAVPADGAVEAFVAAIEAAEVQLVALNFPAGDLSGGDRGLVSWPGRSREFLDGVDVAVGIADRLGVRGFNALYGNRLDGVAEAEQDDLALVNLSRAADAARRVGAVVLLEPVSGAPRYPLRTADDVAAVLERLGRSVDVRLLADLYHLAANDDAVPAAITRHRARIGHVQIADAPGRHEPGTGELPIQAWLAELEDGGYTGWVGLEYLPESDTQSGLSWLPRERRSARTETEAS